MSYIASFFNEVDMQSTKFKARTVLVTGAGSGIGAKIAEHFGLLGATVAIVDLNNVVLEAKK